MEVIHSTDSKKAEANFLHTNKEKPHTPSQPLNDFWPRYHRLAVITTVIMQVTIVFILATSLIIAGVAVSSLAFWIPIIVILIASIALNRFVVIQLLIPLRDLTNAIVSAAGETPRFPMASPNSTQYISTGFRGILQFIYDSAAAKSQAPLAQETVSTSSTLFQTALNNTKTGLIIMDNTGVIQYANYAAPTKEGPEGTRILELMFEADDEFTAWLTNCRNNVVRAEKTWLRVPNRVMGDDTRRIFNVTANYEKSSAAEVVLVAFDATETYQPEDDELDFIAFAAHELRGPITVIRGYLDVLDIEMNEQMAPDQKELMKRLIVSANRLTGYINNILNTSKYDRRHLKLHLQEDTISNVYASIADDMALRASSQQRLLSVTLPDNLPTVAVDRTSIGEVMSNLIDNAIKYSNEGGSIAVTAAASPDFVKVSIADNGIGIPGNVIGNLFHKFYRSHRSRETVAGTGIGLYICKAIVESHGGSIEVISTEGQGSVFSFTVPIFATVADKLLESGNTNTGLISSNEGWIKNHAKFKS